MNESPKDLIKFVRNEIQTLQRNNVKLQYLPIKNKILDLFTETYFEQHKHIVSQLLESHSAIANPITNLDSATFSPGCMICDNVIITGNVSFGSGTIVQPCSKFLATGKGSIVIGADNIFEEQCIVINDSDQDMIIGSFNLFQVGCQIRASTVGNGNKIGVRSTLGWGVQMKNHGLIVAMQNVPDDAVLQDHCLVTPTENRAANRSDNVALHQQQMIDYLTALKSPSSRTCLLNFHKLHKIVSKKEM